MTRAAKRLAGAAASAPFTTAYLASLTVATAVLTSLDGRNDDRVAAALSTNLHQLGRAPLRVLVGSAFWTSGWGELCIWLLFGLLAAPLERRVGWRRTAVAFAAGHVGATLLVAAGLLIGVESHALDRGIERAPDVGASYGFLALAGVASYLLPRRVRLLFVGPLVGYVVGAAVVGHTFTDFGHLLAVAIGLACRPLIPDAGRAAGSAAAGARRAARGTPLPHPARTPRRAPSRARRGSA